MIGIFNCQTSNLSSVVNAIEYINQRAKVINTPEEAESCSHYILPGVGTFDDGMKSLMDSGLDKSIKSIVRMGRPLLGICLGMQLLCSSSEEGSPIQGLNLISGEIRRIATTERLPHIGWNNTELDAHCPIFKGIENDSSFYYLHSYAFVGDDDSVFAKCDYGVTINSAIWKDNVYGVQFHPEKSQETGLNILRNFLEL